MGVLTSMRRLSFASIGFAIPLLTIASLRYLGATPIKAPTDADANPRTPVVVELFTSEGCSSCPPADALLERLDRSQPVGAAELIVLSEHVDYWNDIGWKDPYSSHEYSERQSEYAKRFGLPSVYTPQMVVDGRIEFSGGDARRAIQAIENSTKVEKPPVALSSVHLEGDHTIAVHIEAGPLLPSSAKLADVLIATVDDSDESHVSRGENAGRTLRHVAVLRDLMQVGTVGRSAKFSRDLKINLKNANPRNLRIVAIVQEMTAGRIWGAGAARLSN
jgi:hypothetical protein